MTLFPIALMAAGLLLIVAIAAVRVARHGPRRRHPAKGIQASSAAERGGYEPASLFGSGPWPMETHLDRREPEPTKASTPKPTHDRLAAPRHPGDLDRPEEDIAVRQTRRQRRRDSQRAERPEDQQGHDRPISGEATAADDAAGEPSDPRREDATGELPAAPSGGAGSTPESLGAEPTSASLSPGEADPVADVWAPPRRRGFLRRRRTEEDLLSPVFRRRTAEPKLVVRLDKPRVTEEAVPSEPASPSSPAETFEATPGPAPTPAQTPVSETPEAPAPAEKSQTRRVRRTKRSSAAPDAGTPRIIHLVDPEDEDQPQQKTPAPDGAQRVTPAPQPDAVVVVPKPEQEPEADQASVPAAPAADETGPLVDALSRASQTGLDAGKRARSTAAQAPPGALPDPLPFIRGIGRTRPREAPAPPSPPPPVMHIQTIYLDEQGEPVIVTEEEAAETKRRETARQEAARRQAEAAEREAAEREAVLRAATAVKVPLEPEPHAAPESPPVPAVPAPAAAETTQDVPASWEPFLPEPPVDAPWTEAAPAASAGAHAAEERPDTPVEPSPPATPAAGPPPAPSHEPGAPTAGTPEASAAEASTPAVRVPEVNRAGPETVGPPQASPGQAAPAGEPPPAPAPRRVSRPAAIGPRPDRKPPTRPDPDGPRPMRPAAGPPRETPAGTPAAGVIPLSTGSAVRPHVTVNLTEEDIQGSDELYEVKALLNAITRDPHRNPKNRKKPAPDQPAARPAALTQDRPAPQQAGPSRPAAAPSKPPAAARGSQPGLGITPGPTALPRRPSPWAEGARTEDRSEGRPQRPLPRPEPRPVPRAQPRPPAAGSQPGTGPSREPRLEPRRPVADTRPADPAPPAKPPAARRKAARPVTLILVDEEGRPQVD